jgi:hypothetical protein
MKKKKNNWKIKKVSEFLDFHNIRTKNEHNEIRFPQRDFYKFLDLIILLSNPSSLFLEPKDEKSHRIFISDIHIMASIDIFLEVCGTDTYGFTRPFKFDEQTFEIIITRNHKKLYDYVYRLICDNEDNLVFNENWTGNRCIIQMNSAG